MNYKLPGFSLFLVIFVKSKNVLGCFKPDGFGIFDAIFVMYFSTLFNCEKMKLNQFSKVCISVNNFF